MKGFSIPLLAALALPIPINAEGYGVDVAKRQLPEINKLEQEARKFYMMRAYDVACGKQLEANLLIKMNFDGLEVIAPSVDWFEYRKNNVNLAGIYCKANQIPNSYKYPSTPYNPTAPKPFNTNTKPSKNMRTPY
tara:strand:+ start:1333 stop:1737 length:405 start_codon:yes stop_codon:yes gene_type:complete